MSTQTDNSELIAVLASDVKKLIKHFKLDRRNGGDGEVPSAPDSALLENINSSIIELSARRGFTDEQIAQLKATATLMSGYSEQKQNEGQAELKSLLEIITGKLDEHQAAPQKTTTRHEYNFSIDFRNSKTAITMTTMALVIIASLGFNIHQANRNSDLYDSDIKYRYVKMQLKASTEDLRRLESIFDYDRNTDSMKTIRRQVEHYEQLLKEYNENEYRRRQNEARALEIEQEAATVKGNK